MEEEDVKRRMTEIVRGKSFWADEIVNRVQNVKERKEKHVEGHSGKRSDR